MMKKEWVRPQTLVEQFVPNEYVAACGDGGKVYKFKCNAGLDDKGNPITHGIFGNKYIWNVYTNEGEELTNFFGKYGPCGATHEANETDDFIEGYMDDAFTSDNENIKVIIWTNHNTDIHCTTNLNMSTWETAKS